jgi:hypothetical protein
MKLLTAILFFTLSTSLFAALPIENVSDQVVVIGTPEPIKANDKNFTVDQMLQFERDFASQSGKTIAAVLATKSKEGYILTGILPISASTPVVAHAQATYSRSGLITAAVLVFTKLGAEPSTP